MADADRQSFETGRPYWGEPDNDDRVEALVEAREQRRQAQIAMFAKKQKRLRQWIPFSDIADWCGREGGSIKLDPQRVKDAYAELEKSLLDGEFEYHGRARVMFLDPTASWLKMSVTRYDLIPYATRFGYLQDCWIPSTLCRSWFVAKRMELPQWLPLEGRLTELKAGALLGEGGSVPPAGANFPSPQRPVDLPKPGRQSIKKAAAEQAMREVISMGEMTIKALMDVPKKNLPQRFSKTGAGETACYEARRTVYAEYRSR